MICTSNYDEKFDDRIRRVSISGDRGKGKNYDGECFQALAPTRDFWDVWKANKGNVPEEQNTLFYFTEYYRRVLSKLDPQDVYDQLDGSVLLCYEKSHDFCHRHIVAAWLELLLDIEVPEVKSNGGKLEYVQRNAYYKKVLKKIMEGSQDMKGFTSLRALYLDKRSKTLTMRMFDEHDEAKREEIRNAALECKMQSKYLEMFNKMMEENQTYGKKRVQRI